MVIKEAIYMKNGWNRIIIALGLLFIVLGIITGYNDLISGYSTSNYGLQGNGFELVIVIIGFFMIYYSRTSLKLMKMKKKNSTIEKRILRIIV